MQKCQASIPNYCSGCHGDKFWVIRNCRCWHCVIYIWHAHTWSYVNKSTVLLCNRFNRFLFSVDHGFTLKPVSNWILVEHTPRHYISLSARSVEAILMYCVDHERVKHAQGSSVSRWHVQFTQYLNPVTWLTSESFGFGGNQIKY